MAAEVEPAAARMPAATDMAMKSRRETSPVSFVFSESCRSRLSSVIVFTSPFTFLGTIAPGTLYATAVFFYLHLCAKPYVSGAAVSSHDDGETGPCARRLPRLFTGS